jgi:hypothetical protein
MKQPKRLTRSQKECLSSYGLNADDWGLIVETDFYLKIVNRKNGDRKSLDKFRRGKRI